MCHVLTVFTFTDSVRAACIHASDSACPQPAPSHVFPQAKYAYRSIAEFIKHVTSHSAEHLDKNPFPEFHLPPEEIADSASEDEDRSRRWKSKRNSEQPSKFASIFKRNRGEAPPPVGSEAKPADVSLYRGNEETAKEEHEAGKTETVNGNPEPSASNSSSFCKVEIFIAFDITPLVNPRLDCS